MHDSWQIKSATKQRVFSSNTSLDYNILYLNYDNLSIRHQSSIQLAAVSPGEDNVRCASLRMDENL